MKNLWLILFGLLVAGAAQAQSAGSMQVVGEPGRFQLFQKVKAIRCETTQRGTCDAAVFFNLNQAQALPAGQYIVGFENSLYPGLVSVGAGQAVKLYLERVTVPAAVKGQKVRVFRDVSNALEQNKIMTSMYWMKRHFFRLDVANFGDLYLTGAWERDFTQRISYEACANMKSVTAIEARDAKQVCEAWNTAQRPEDLAALYDFKSDGTFVEKWVSAPGDVFPTTHPKYLVSVPMTDQDFVAVFPGVYKVQAEGKGTPAVTVRVGGGLF